jgi:CPA1 family monovalent cation:H+ antiporter
MRFFGGRKRVLRLLDKDHRLAVGERLAKHTVVLANILREGAEAWPERLLDRSLHERRSMAGEIDSGMFGRSVQGRFQPGYVDELINGFYVERRVIHQFLDRGEITAEQANELRGDVNRLEIYTLSGKHGASVPMINMFTKLREKMTNRLP